MPAHPLRVVLVGASSLLGRELSDEIIESPLGTAEILLFDSEAVEGQVTTIGDEASFIRRVSATSFEGAAFVFFAGSQEQTREHWQTARKAGAMVVDLTHALTDEAEVMVWSPWVAPLNGRAHERQSLLAGRHPDLQTAAVVPAHPVATALALLATRLSEGLQKPRILVTTVLQPASELGRSGMDELHQQTVSLLSFKDLPQTTFDAQTAFNILAELGEEATLKLAARAAVIEAQYEALSNSQLPQLTLQLLQVPVFHGYTFSIFLEFEKKVSQAALVEALRGARVEIVEATDPPSNLSAAGRSDLLVSVSLSNRVSDGRSFWLCVAADNLKLAAANAIDCALGMRSLRPQGKVQ